MAVSVSAAVIPFKLHQTYRIAENVSRKFDRTRSTHIRSGLQARAWESWAQKNRLKGRLFCCFWTWWEVQKTLYGASGETRTLTLSPETDFESAASTDSATEAMAAQYRDEIVSSQRFKWSYFISSGKLCDLSR